MRTTSATEQDRSARHELSVFMERFMHLAEGTAVLAHSERDEGDEQVFRPVQDLHAALDVMDLAIEQFRSEKDKVARLQAELESEKQSHRLKSEKDFSSIGEWIGRYKQLFSENIDLKARLAVFEEQFGAQHR